MKTAASPLQSSRGFIPILIILILGAGAFVVFSGNGKEWLSKIGISIGTPTTSNTSEEAAIKEAVRKDCEVYKTTASNKDAKYILAVLNQLEIKGNFARANEGCFLDDGQGGSGNLVILKKTNGEWKIVAGGQELPSKAKGQMLGLPDGWYSTSY